MVWDLLQCMPCARTGGLVCGGVPRGSSEVSRPYLASVASHFGDCHVLCVTRAVVEAVEVRLPYPWLALQARGLICNDAGPYTEQNIALYTP